MTVISSQIPLRISWCEFLLKPKRMMSYIFWQDLIHENGKPETFDIFFVIPLPFLWCFIRENNHFPHKSVFSGNCVQPTNTYKNLTEWHSIANTWRWPEIRRLFPCTRGTLAKVRSFGYTMRVFLVSLDDQVTKYVQGVDACYEWGFSYARVTKFLH